MADKIRMKQDRAVYYSVDNVYEVGKDITESSAQHFVNCRWAEKISEEKMLKGSSENKMLKDTPENKEKQDSESEELSAKKIKGKGYFIFAGNKKISGPHTPSELKERGLL